MNARRPERMLQLPAAKMWFHAWWIGWIFLLFSPLFARKRTETIEHDSTPSTQQGNGSETTVKERIEPHIVENGPSEATSALTNGKLNEVINALRRCGVEEILDLPKIAVIGNQSVGKSSLIESISGINVPRSQGTCTRCPMEVTMRSNKSVNGWTCQVYVYDEKTKKTVPFGKATHDRTKVESILCRAQLATLNPGCDDVTFYANLEDAECEKYTDVLNNAPGTNDNKCSRGASKSRVAEHERDKYLCKIRFSEKPIVVEIDGDEHDLTFIDLPGLISNHKDENMIKLTRKLVNDYVEKLRCLCLVVITMTDNIENQEGRQIARKLEQEGKRAVGVLTKADLIPPGEEHLWMKILRNNPNGEHYLLHGYYVTRQLATDQRERGNIQRSEAKQIEREFFERKNTIWRETDQTRLGTENLSKALSFLLADMIRESIPDLKKKLSSEYGKLKLESQKLPEQNTEDPREIVNGLCNQFLADVTGNACFSTTHLDLFNSFQTLFRKLKSDLASTRPNFPVGGQHNQNYRTRDSESSDKHDGMRSKSYTLDKIKGLLEELHGPALPAYIPSEAVTYLMKKIISEWSPICLGFFESAKEDAKELMSELCKLHFSSVNSKGLSLAVKQLADEELDRLAMERTKLIKGYCEMEWRRPFAQDIDDFKLKSNDRYNELSIKTFGSCMEMNSSFSTPCSYGTGSTSSSLPASPYLQEEPPKALQEAPPIMSRRKVAGRKASSESAGLKNAIRVVADVETYFDIAWRRTFNVVPMFVAEYYIQFSDKLRNTLFQRLGLYGEHGDEKCREFAAEDPRIAARRAEIKRQLKVLAEATNILDQF